MNVVYGCYSPSRSSQTAGQHAHLTTTLTTLTYTQHLYAYTHTWSIIIRITLERHFSSIYTWANNSSDWRLGERTVLFGLGGAGWLVGWCLAYLCFTSSCIGETETHKTWNTVIARIFIWELAKGGGNTPLERERGTRALIARYKEERAWSPLVGIVREREREYTKNM